MLLQVMALAWDIGGYIDTSTSALAILRSASSVSWASWWHLSANNATLVALSFSTAHAIFERIIE
jgi:hypothetical protein